MTHISWTEKTWNPIAGCSVLSAGCTNCYAMRDAHRLAGNPNAKIAAKYGGLTRLSGGRAVWTGKVNLDEAALLAPLRRRAPTTYFVNSMSDLFHEAVPDEWIDRIFAVMALSPQHRFQVLTKRSGRMREYVTKWHKRVAVLSAAHGGLPGQTDDILARADLTDQKVHVDNWKAGFANIWLGVSVEDQAAADARIPDLLATPAALRFLSCEPLLGPVDLERLSNGSENGWINAISGLNYWAPGAAPIGPKIDWVIVGGESGARARPMHPDWARQIRDQCAAAGVPFHFKQWGEWIPDDQSQTSEILLSWGAERPALGRAGDAKGCKRKRWRPVQNGCIRVGKKAAGRMLDGVLHDAVPQ